MKMIVLAMMASALLSISSFASEGKDECLLYSVGCPNEQMDIFQIIDNLQTEIGKTDVYTQAEIRVLERKLVEYQELLRNLEKGGH